MLNEGMNKPGIFPYRLHLVLMANVFISIYEWCYENDQGFHSKSDMEQRFHLRSTWLQISGTHLLHQARFSIVLHCDSSLCCVLALHWNQWSWNLCSSCLTIRCQPVPWSWTNPPFASVWATEYLPLSPINPDLFPAAPDDPQPGVTKGNCREEHLLDSDTIPCYVNWESGSDPPGLIILIGSIFTLWGGRNALIVL